MRKVELLSPAGDLERLKVTLLYGADAVYIGGQEYSLRANATNFSIEEIKEGCSFAHKLGKKVYLTLNIVMHNEDLEGLEEYIKEVVDAGIDAFIVSDPCIISHIVENYPQVETHLSTQNSTSNYEAVKYFKNEGVKRVVLARELNKNEIKEIKCIKFFNFLELKILNLGNNLIYDVSELEKVKFYKLEILALNNNVIENINFFEKNNFLELKEINLENNLIYDISVPKLEKLSLYNNNIYNINCLKMAKFKCLKELYLFNNQINNLNEFFKAKFKNVKAVNHQ